MKFPGCAIGRRVTGPSQISGVPVGGTGPHGECFCLLVISGLMVIFCFGGSVSWAEDLLGVEGAVGYSSAVDLVSYESVELHPVRKEISAPLMVTLAYLLLWFMVLVFVGWSWSKARRLRFEVRMLRKRLEDLEGRLENESIDPSS